MRWRATFWDVAGELAEHAGYIMYQLAGRLYVLADYCDAEAANGDRAGEAS